MLKKQDDEREESGSGTADEGKGKRRLSGYGSAYDSCWGLRHT